MEQRIATPSAPDAPGLRINDVPMEYADGVNSKRNSATIDEASDQLPDLPPHLNPPAKRLNRRNSISLPSGLELEHLSLSQEMPRREDESDSSVYSEGEEDGGLSAETEDEEVTIKVPLRSRRKSVMPKIKINDEEMLEAQDGENSPHNSVTSINSIASLLKEKLAMSLPSMLKNKRPQEYKLKAFVAILFMCIVFLVGFAHVYYHQQVLQRAYFDNIRFNKEERVVRIFNNDQVELLHGNVGTFLGHHDVVYQCLPDDERNDGSVCMEWIHRARLYLSYSYQDEVRCYNIHWMSLDVNVHPTDCYDWSEGSGHWYGGGQTSNMAWPLDNGTVDWAPFITGDVMVDQWGSVLSRYFINSKGVSISIDQKSPLYLSIKAEGTDRFCLKAKYDDFAYVNRPSYYPQLNYTICTSESMDTVYEFLSEKNLWDGLKKEDLEVVNSILTEPIWQIATADQEEPLTEAAIYNYTEDVISLGFLRQGHVLLDEHWQTNIGDFSLDLTRFPTMEDTIKIIHRRGFRIIFAVQPYISTDSFNFHEAVKNGLLIVERESRYPVPALVQYKETLSAGVLDATQNRTVTWLQTKIRALIDRYSIDSFLADVGTAYDLPHYYKFDGSLLNPDHYKKYFTDAILQGAGAAQKSVAAVSSAISRPRATVFVTLPPFASTWEAMAKIIPTVLTYGVAGYPFVMPGPVGGDYGVPLRAHNLTLLPAVDIRMQAEATSLRLPDMELYVRWLQLATFLPVVRYTYLPSKYNDEKLLETAKALTSLRVKIVNPLLTKYVRIALDTGLPLIRPLWMLDPGDPACHEVADEFSVGTELIVAPIIHPGTSEREVYLPAGVWKDGVDGSLRKGGRWLHNYRVPFDKIAHFIKMPDNTRF